MVVAKNNIRFAIRNQESGRLAGMGVLLVIPAEAGIQVFLIFPGPRPSPGRDVTRAFGQRLRHLLSGLNAKSPGS